MDIAEAGSRYYQLGRSASYAAAKRGDMPCIQIGRRKVAVTALIHRQLGLPLDDIEVGAEAA